MKKIFLFAAVIAAIAADAEQITVLRRGRDAWIRSRFSKTHDIVIAVWRDANEKAFLVPRGSDIRQAEKGLCLHTNSDEYPATNFAGYGFLSGNHGSAAARLVTAPGHGFTASDIGRVLTDEKKRTYVLAMILSAGKFVMHPEPVNPNAPVGRAVFPRHSREKLFVDGREIRFTSSVLTQLRPLNRVTRNEFLVDGRTPLPDNTVVRCDFLDHVFEHDVVAPEELVRFIREKAGRKIVPKLSIGTKMFYPADEPGAEDYMKLAPLMAVKNRLRYQDNGAMVNYRECTYPVSLAGVNQLEVMFGWTGEIAKGKYQMFYIPKTRPSVFPSRSDRNKKYECDFVRGVDISGRPDINGSVAARNAADPANPPERFIRVTGKSAPEYGIAVGYSLISGCTAKGSGRDAGCYYHLWYTQKMYPYAYTLRNNRPGTKRATVSYKQYFCPAEEPDLTAFYCHRQGDSLVVYVEAHKALDGKRLALPPETEGMKITVVEKSPSVTLLAQEKVHSDGVRISLKGDYGHIVLKLDR
ncbi:MAG: hypothetical protein IJU70_04005 [Lentisphaeria bacterium]|nr:hypothetical protein [Lentisphaeria bacterium]